MHLLAIFWLFAFLSSHQKDKVFANTHLNIVSVNYLCMVRRVQAALRNIKFYSFKQVFLEQLTYVSLQYFDSYCAVSSSQTLRS